MRLLSALAILITLLLGAPPTAFAQDTSLDAPPAFEIPIPGLELTPIIRDSEVITVPWLAQYIGGVYTFLLGIVGVVASVVMMVGGFQYVTSGGDKGKVGAAKTKISNALIGLVLALGSYTVLYAINPDLVAFEGLQVVTVKTESDWDTTMGTTTIDTAAESEPVTVGTAPPPPSGPCPFTLSAKAQSDSVAGRKEFYDAVRAPGVIKATTPAAKVIEIGNLAIQCKVWLGSCGRTAGAINALAGVISPTPAWASCCLDEVACKASCSQYSGKQKKRCLDGAGNCNDHSKGKDLFRISSEQRLNMYAIRCDVEGGKSWPICQNPGPWPNSSAKCIRQDCVTSGVAARNKFRDYLLAEAAAGRLPANWPDDWANKLVPGDRLVIYNGNHDLVGAHAIIFTGWAKDGIRAQVIQGSYGTPTKGGTWCIKKACGSKLYPLINAWRP